jgi:hypothetical protein
MRKFLRAFLVAVMSVFLLHPSMMAHAEGENSATKGTNQEKVVVSKTKLQKLQADAADEKVLLIMDVRPWGFSEPQNVLGSLGITFDTVNMSQVSSLNLSNYKLVIIPNDQNSSYYNGYANVRA